MLNPLILIKIWVNQDTLEIKKVLKCFCINSPISYCLITEDNKQLRCKK